jgi:DNA/RNA-binding domain of Phe-tRNA-synthetase-like protein
MISITHAIKRSDVLLGLIQASNIHANKYPPRFEDHLLDLLGRRRSGLGPDEEAVRAAARDMMRNGTYKPTGRGKPASEYLLRAAADGSFPRINAPVDICNLLSLKYALPISLWDVDLSGADEFVFRLGQPGERYVFNEGGQAIDVQDLLVGCRVRGDDNPAGDPIVNPVKDSLATKTTPGTAYIAACIYAPAPPITVEQLEAICVEFGKLLAGCGENVISSHAVLETGSSTIL